MTTSKPATPLPWHVNAVDSKRGRVTGDETSAGWDKLFLNGNNNTIASVYLPADARFATHACNAYPELVAALRVAMDSLDDAARAPKVQHDRGAEAVEIAALLAKLGETT